MAAREGWSVEGEYHDEGFSAYSGNRGPGLVAAKQEAGAIAAEHGEAILLVWASDRLARGAGDAPGAAAHLSEVFHELARAGVTIRSVTDDPMVTSPLLVAFAGWRATEDSRLKGERVRAGSRRRAERGDHHGGPTPFGYRRTIDRVTGNRQLEIEPAEAAIVVRIYRELAAGRSQKQIARGLVADSIPTKLGANWSQSQVGRILRTPLYRGVVVLNGVEREGRHETIIDEELWARVASLRDATARTRGAGRGRLPAKHLLVRGALKCSCGASMNCRTSHDTYTCAAHVRDPETCAHPPVPRAAVDTAILDHFRLVGLDLDATRAALQENIDSELACVRTLVAEAERAEQRSDAALARVKADYLAGELPASDWVELRQELESDIDAARAEVSQLRQRELQFAETSLDDAEDQVLEQIDQLRAAIASEVTNADGIAAVRVALSSLFDSFILYRYDAKDSPLVRKAELKFRDGADRSWFLVPQVLEQVIETRIPRAKGDFSGFESDRADLILRRLPLEFSGATKNQSA